MIKTDKWQTRPLVRGGAPPPPKKKSLVKSPKLGSTPRHTDWLTVGRNVILTLTWPAGLCPSGHCSWIIQLAWSLFPSMLKTLLRSLLTNFDLCLFSHNCCEYTVINICPPLSSWFTAYRVFYQLTYETLCGYYMFNLPLYCSIRIHCWTTTASYNSAMIL
jgi:hypothetical protein